MSGQVKTRTAAALRALAALESTDPDAVEAIRLHIRDLRDEAAQHRIARRDETKP